MKLLLLLLTTFPPTPLSILWYPTATTTTTTVATSICGVLGVAAEVVGDGGGDGQLQAPVACAHPLPRAETAAADGARTAITATAIAIVLLVSYHHFILLFIQAAAVVE